MKEKSKFLIIKLITGFTFFLFFFGIGMSFAVAQINPNNYNKNPLNLNPNPNLNEGYGWCISYLEVIMGDSVFQCNIAEAHPVPTVQQIAELNYKEVWNDPYASGGTTCPPGYVPGYNPKISPDVICVGTELAINYKNISSPSDYLKRICYAKIYGGVKNPMYTLNKDKLTTDIGISNINSIIGGAVVIDRIDTWSGSVLPSLPEKESWNTCKIKIPNPEETCTYDAKSLVGPIFKNKFPLDIFDSNVDYSAVSVNSRCPQATIMGQIFELCFLRDISTMLKYVILLLFIIKSINYL